MKPLRKNVAISIDGGGIKGIIVTRALSMLEDALGQSSHDVFRLATGTSTGSIIAAGIGAGLTAKQMHELYITLGASIFQRSWRTTFFPLSRFRYPIEPLESALREYLGSRVMGDYWQDQPPTDIVITSLDLVTNRALFIKPWKEEYRHWPVVKAVLASSAVPTYFPVIDGRYVDGGIGSYANPSYLAAYELLFCLRWDPAETTLISLGTGRDPHKYDPQIGSRYFAWQWIEPLLSAFLQSAGDQQVHLVDTFFKELDFRRFQVDLQQPFAMDDPTKMEQLTAYGEEMGHKILNDLVDPIQSILPPEAPDQKGIK